MQVLSSKNLAWMQQIDALCLSLDVESRWVQTSPERVYTLELEAEKAPLLLDCLAEMLTEERMRLDEAAKTSRSMSNVSLLAQPAFAFGVFLAGVVLAFFVVSGGSANPTVWQQVGVLRGSLVLEAGEWWRLVTAACLHGDSEHATGNAVFLLVLGWASAERVGSGLTLLGWLMTAVVGFVVSLYFSPTVASLGSSGGLFGLLGLAGGHGALTPVVDHELGWRRNLRTVGAALMLLALLAFSPESNIKAHVAGFFSGAAMGALLGRWPMPQPVIQVGAWLVSVGVIVGAWHCALSL